MSNNKTKRTEMDEYIYGYDDITQQEFADGLWTVVSRLSTAEVLAIPGVFEVLSEELNNNVLELLRGDDDDE